MPQARGRLGARTTILAAAVGHSATGGNLHPCLTPVGVAGDPDLALHVPDRPLWMADCGTLEVVAQITATAVPPSMKSTRPSSSPKT